MEVCHTHSAICVLNLDMIFSFLQKPMIKEHSGAAETSSQLNQPQTQIAFPVLLSCYLIRQQNVSSTAVRLAPESYMQRFGQHHVTCLLSVSTSHTRHARQAHLLQIHSGVLKAFSRKLTQRTVYNSARRLQVQARTKHCKIVWEMVCAQNAKH